MKFHDCEDFMKTLLLTLVAALAVASYASDWPQFRGPNADGISPETGLNKDWKAKPPKELWKIDLGDNGYAGPAIAGGKLYIIDHAGSNDVVRAVDVATGKEVWKFEYADAGNDNYGFSRSTPTVSNGKVYTLSRQGRLHCLDAAKGEKLWLRDLRGEFEGKVGEWEYAWSPLVDGDKVIVCPGGAKGVVALNKNDGKEIWTGGTSDNAGYATPVVATIAGKKQYLIFSGKNLAGVDAEKGGAPLWQFPWATSYEVNAASPLPIGAFVFITSGYGKGCALVNANTEKPAAIWQNGEIKAHFNSPVYINNCIFGTGDPGTLVCLDPQSGHANWKQNGFEKGGLLAVDGTLIVIDGANGDVVQVAADTKAYKELGRFKPLGGQSWTSPAIADGKLYIRNTKKLGCYDLK
jgi:outer membrane protein assembly factor BamB